MKRFLTVLSFILMASAWPSFHVSAHAESLFIGGVSFEIPGEWPEDKVSSPMRTAQYRIPKAEADAADGELAVFFFGEGQGGDINANIVRWQQQFEQADDREGQIEKKVINGVSVTTVFLHGSYNPGLMAGGSGETKKDYAMKGAIISGTQGNVFIKLVAPRLTMQSASDSFEKMLSTIQSTLS